jgi:hypothetical protein
VNIVSLLPCAEDKGISVAGQIKMTSPNIPFTIEIIGSDLYGDVFMERTRPLTIHPNGASILIAHKLAPDSEIIIRNLETNEEATALVVGQIREDQTGSLYGVAFLDAAINLWHMQFPSAGTADVIRLECGGCRSVCAVSIANIEMEVFKARQELTRFCSVCKSTKIWKATVREVTEVKAASAPKPDPAAAAKAAPKAEARKYRRTAMKVAACIRYHGREDIVDCEDVSKGGFRFTGLTEYPKGTRVEASVPYTKSSMNIFSLAAIVHNRKLPDRRFQHGATYIKVQELTR